jgi:hypothetical protein
LNLRRANMLLRGARTLQRLVRICPTKLPRDCSQSLCAWGSVDNHPVEQLFRKLNLYSTVVLIWVRCGAIQLRKPADAHRIHARLSRSRSMRNFSRSPARNLHAALKCESPATGSTSRRASQLDRWVELDHAQYDQSHKGESDIGCDNAQLADERTDESHKTSPWFTPLPM